ncbi:sulfotransferase family 2 domain-containing protein [bacterium]|nr:sulfotransferase family 2 domain-containing protein [bacterium]
MIEKYIKNIKQNIDCLLTVKKNIYCKRLAKYSIVGKYYRIYHYHIRKTGGKSLLFMFMANECQDYYKKYEELYTNIDHRIIINNKVFALWHPIILQQGNYYYGASHIPYHSLKLPDRTFTITCLSDPVDRIISHYKMLLRKKKIQHQSWGLKRELHWLGGSFEYFLKSISKNQLLNQLYMFSKSFTISEAVDNILKCNHIQFLESFNEGITILENKLNIKLKLLHADREICQTNINQLALDQLREILYPEYKFIEQIKKEI